MGYNRCSLHIVSDSNYFCNFLFDFFLHSFFFSQTPEYSIIARAGSNYYYKGGSARDIEKIIQHPNYDRRFYDYDIALLKLSEPINFDATMQPIALATYSRQSNDLCTLTGWGGTRPGDVISLSDTPRSIVIPFISSNDCSKLSDYENQISERMICAGDVFGSGCEWNQYFESIFFL